MFNRIRNVKEAESYIQSMNQIMYQETKQFKELMKIGGIWETRALGHNSWICPSVRVAGHLYTSDILTKEQFPGHCIDMAIKYEELLLSVLKERGEVLINKDYGIVQVEITEGEIVDGPPPLNFAELKDSKNLVIENSTELNEEFEEMLSKEIGTDYSLITNLKTFTVENLKWFLRKLQNENIKDGKLSYNRLELYFESDFVNEGQLKSLLPLIPWFKIVHVKTKNDNGFNTFVELSKNFEVKIERLK